jgi:hypothetical protein
MVQFVYIDETGSVGKGGAKQPYLTLAAVLTPEDQVQPLARAMRAVAFEHLGWLPKDFEFHGHEIWGGTGWWSEQEPPELIAAFEAVIDLLGRLDLSIVHSSIDKVELHAKYNGHADGNAYLLALQFLLEKIDRWGSQNRIIIADEAKEHQLRAIKMVAEMQEWGGGEVPGRTLKTVIDYPAITPKQRGTSGRLCRAGSAAAQDYRSHNNVARAMASASKARLTEFGQPAPTRPATVSLSCPRRLAQAALPVNRRGLSQDPERQ